MSRKFSIDVTVIPVAGRHVAGATVGGFTLRGQAAEKPGDAARNLLWKLAGRDQDDDAIFAVDLAVEGTTLESALQLTDGGSND